MFFGRQTTRRRVALFGGSFDPPHVGHTAICKWLFHKNLCEEVWVIPCFQHPFAKPLQEFDHRLMMCKLAFATLGLPIRILDIERKLGGESRTLRTVETVLSEHPELKFNLVVGEDIEQEREKWHGFERITGLVDLIRVPRGKSSPIPDVSSTEIRRRIAAGESWRGMVEPEVAVYLVTKALYR